REGAPVFSEQRCGHLFFYPANRDSRLQTAPISSYGFDSRVAIFPNRSAEGRRDLRVAHEIPEAHASTRLCNSLDLLEELDNLAIVQPLADVRQGKSIYGFVFAGPQELSES